MGIKNVFCRGVAFGVFVTVFALSSPEYVVAISDDEAGRVSQNCESIRASLKQLQRADLAIRDLFGNTYNNVEVKFMSPLNVRMTRNGLAPFLDFRNEFSAERMEFTAIYKKYAGSLSDLIATDCKNRPEEFYNKLNVVRGNRAMVRSSIGKLNSLLTIYKSEVTEMRNAL